MAARINQLLSWILGLLPMNADAGGGLHSATPDNFFKVMGFILVWGLAITFLKNKLK